MPNVDIFNVVDSKPKGTFVKFTNVGDEVQGTYIDRYEGESRFGPQTVIVLKDKEGNLKNVGVKKDTKASEILIKEVDKANFGEIVGFRLSSIKPPKVSGYNPSKIIKFYRDPSVVDAAWLAANPHRVNMRPANSNSTATSPAPVAAAPATAQAVRPAVPQAVVVYPDSFAPTLTAIRNLARSQGLTNDSMSATQQDEAIVASTGLALNEQNATQIIVKLTSLTK